MLPWWALALALALARRAGSKTECVSVSGQLICARDPALHHNVKIELLDYDGLAWEKDDLMGVAWSAANGSFSLRGCGYDFGSWNTPDPYLKIHHKCRSSSGDTTTIGVLPVFEPATSNVGRIRLDDEYD